MQHSKHNIVCDTDNGHRENTPIEPTNIHTADKPAHQWNYAQTLDSGCMIK